MVEVQRGGIYGTNGNSISNNGNLTLSALTVSNASSNKNTIVNAGTLTIKSAAEISSQTTIPISNTGTLNVNDGDVDGVVNNSSSAIINVTGGTISSNGINNKYGTLNLGTNDNTVSTTNPIVSGSTYGVNVSSGTFNFYDGVISGKTAISGEVTSVPDEYIIQKTTNNNIEKAILVKGEPVIENVSKSKKYVDVHTAFKEAASGNQLRLLKSTEIDKPIEISTGKTIYFSSDASYTLNCTNTSKATIINNGELYVESSSDDSILTISSSGSKAIQNVGTLNLESGLITSQVYNTGTVNVTGGAIRQTSTSTNIIGVYNATSASILNISDGQIAAYKSIINYGKFEMSGNGTVNAQIGKDNTFGVQNNGGSVVVKSGDLVGDQNGIINNGGSVVVQGGAVRSDFGDCTGIESTNNGSIDITGGTVSGGINVQSGSTLNLGKNDGNVSISSPIIYRRNTK